MNSVIESLHRFPIKGLSPERLNKIELRVGSGVPFDRVYAITDGTWMFDPENPDPVPKTRFLMLARYEKLMTLKTEIDEASRVLRVTLPCGDTQSFALQEATGRDAASRFFRTYLGETLQGEPAIVSAAGHRFTDVSVHSATLMESISIINLASVNALGERLGRRLDPLRFRANIVIDGADPWIEFDALDREFSIGTARVRAIRRTRRCAATNVNTETGLRDLNIPKSLFQEFGHGDLGIYVEVVSGGTISSGDSVVFS